MSLRPIKKIHAGQREDISDLVTRRALPTNSVGHLDPFLFLNHHGPQTYPPDNDGLPFGPHPHRGFETVTFILGGDIAHRDSGGHESVIKNGGVQWMTAGSGLVHEEVSSEEFMRQGGALNILQLWLNLPSHLKMTAPNYLGLQADHIPKLKVERNEIELVSGSFNGKTGAFQPLVDVTLMIIRQEPAAKLNLEVPADHTIFFYVISGELSVNGKTVKQFHLVEFEDSPTETLGNIEIQTETAATILFGHAKPFHEPIVAHGPFVMNTREEIIQAVKDYQAGKFG
ncbi:MAG: pirin family protein [Bdellovibrionota bacterium]